MLKAGLYGKGMQHCRNLKICSFQNCEMRRSIYKISTLPYKAIMSIKKLLNALRYSLNCSSKIRDLKSYAEACTSTTSCIFCLFHCYVRSD